MLKLRKVGLLTLTLFLLDCWLLLMKVWNSYNIKSEYGSYITRIIRMQDLKNSLIDLRERVVDIMVRL